MAVRARGEVAALARTRVIAVASASTAAIATPRSLTLADRLGSLGPFGIRQGIDEHRCGDLLASDCLRALAFAGRAKVSRAAVASRLAATFVAARLVACAAAVTLRAASITRFTEFAGLARVARFT